MIARTACLILLAYAFLAGESFVSGQQQPLSAGEILGKYAWLDNRDYQWYQRNIPLLETPVPALDRTYYYRWELITKHVVYGAPEDGYAFTEFLDRPFWSGSYGAISCPAGHQLAELRWLRDPRWGEDYLRYWFTVPGAEPRRYSCWLVDAGWALHQVHPNAELLLRLRQPMHDNFQGWRERHWDAAQGMFWQTGHDDGMEWNINSRQTQDEIRGAPGFRPTLNSYLWADARALAKIDRLAGQADDADQLDAFASKLKATMQRELWDPQRTFFFHQARDDEHLDGHTVRAGSLTYQTGRFAGSPHGRELIGYVPWQFNLPDPGYEEAWKHLGEFQLAAGTTTVERHDPLFKLQTRCCMWSGMSWPYATSQTLKAMANVLHNYEQDHFDRRLYYSLFESYAFSHRKSQLPDENMVPYLAEAFDPRTGSWEGHDSFNHSEHYFHSSFIDLLITGLVGVQPQDTDRLLVDPLFPAEWDYCLLQDVPYKGHLVTIQWDRTGERYQRGAGLSVFVDGQLTASRAELGKLDVEIEPIAAAIVPDGERLRNFAVNNSGRHYPKLIASVDSDETPVAKAIDGQYWYLERPGNRWTNAGSNGELDWIGVDFGIERDIEQLVVYFLDDAGENACHPPQQFWFEAWRDGSWVRLSPPPAKRWPAAVGHQASHFELDPIKTERLRLVVPHPERGRLHWGISELETWGRCGDPVPQPDLPRSLSRRTSESEFPRATASFTSRFDRVEEINDGVVLQRPGGSRNRWTAYESPNTSDWVEFDFGVAMEFNRVDLYLYDDGGGVQIPQTIEVQVAHEGRWLPVQPTSEVKIRSRGATEISLDRVTAQKVRLVFTHRLPGKTGATEIEFLNTSASLPPTEATRK